jgi:hypothetical protein
LVDTKNELILSKLFSTMSCVQWRSSTRMFVCLLPLTHYAILQLSAHAVLQSAKGLSLVSPSHQSYSWVYSVISYARGKGANRMPSPLLGWQPLGLSKSGTTRAGSETDDPIHRMWQDPVLPRSFIVAMNTSGKYPQFALAHAYFQSQNNQTLFVCMSTMHPSGL